MTPDQEKLLRDWSNLWTDGPQGRCAPELKAIKTLAQVVLELAAKVDNPLRVVDLTVPVAGSLLQQLVDCAAEHPSLKLADWSDGVRDCYARALVLDLLSVLDCDPGHDATYGYLRAGEERCQTVEAYRAIIQAIRRGE